MSKLILLQKYIDRQSEDDGLWFKAEFASEGYLQSKLRELHYLIEEGTDECIEKAINNYHD